MEVVVGISGASGVIYGIRLLQVLKDYVTHLIITHSAHKIIELETNFMIKEIEELADYVYEPHDFTAPIASGSFRFDAMVVIPCSMGTLAAIASGTSDTLIARSADVCLKEQRKLILVTRETPLNLVQLKNMVSAVEAGAIVLPACPAYYSRPENIEELVDALIGRVLDQLGLENNLFRRWGEMRKRL
ncbi:MAG: UbiX family flavin prenyltransferase [Methanotrichaceae archaeon]|nr:UbiX family flavin prenyltransferase [Methanotrichaceae archaeon]